MPGKGVGAVLTASLMQFIQGHGVCVVGGGWKKGKDSEELSAAQKGDPGAFVLMLSLA